MRTVPITGGRGIHTFMSTSDPTGDVIETGMSIALGRDGIGNAHGVRTVEPGLADTDMLEVTK
jgi:hypothetical protein